MQNSQVEQTKNSADGGLFQVTQWSLVLRARDDSADALNLLCEKYRKPLIVWLRTRGHSSQDAEDIVQGLFAQLLSRQFLQNLAREKGRFRTFLLRCLKNYLMDEHERNASQRRGGGQTVESLDATDHSSATNGQVADQSPTPDVAFERAWAANLLANAWHRLQEECALQGHSTLCAELEPVMFHDEDASGYREIGGRLGMSEAAVKMAASRIRARLKGIVRDEILQTVSNGEDWESEVHYLMSLFAR